MLLDIVVYGLIAAYTAVVILGHVFLLRALIRRTSDTKAARDSIARDSSRILANSKI